MTVADNQLRLVLVMALYLRTKRRNARRSVWVQDIFRRRREQEYHNLLKEMQLSDVDSHFRYLRVSKQHFDSLLSKITSLKIIIFLVSLVYFKTCNE